MRSNTSLELSCQLSAISYSLFAFRGSLFASESARFRLVILSSSLQACILSDERSEESKDPYSCRAPLVSRPYKQERELSFVFTGFVGLCQYRCCFAASKISNAR